MKKVILLFLAFCLCLGGCSVRVEKSGSPTETASEAPTVPTTEPIIQAEDHVSDVVLLSADKEYTPDIISKPNDDTIAVMNDFAVELLKKELASKDRCENTIISPLSVLYAMGMAATGAENETLTEMLDVLAGGMSLEEFNKFISYYTKRSLKDNSSLSIDNSVWIREKYANRVNDSYITDTVNYYNASIFKAPFNKKTKDEINGWISEKTDGEIDKMIEVIPDEVVMYLINTILFDASWEKPFSEPFEGTFTTSDGREQTVDMMRCSEFMPYVEAEGVTGFYKYYEDNGYSFLALLPEEGVDAYDYAMSLTGEDFVSFRKNAKTNTTVVTMPTFEAESETDLAEALRSMGIKRAFTFREADFGGISEEDAKVLYIDSVLHKARMEVDKNGTKAAAATVVQLVVGSAADLPEPEFVTLDRPFVYAIVDGKGTPIFIGVQNSIE